MGGGFSRTYKTWFYCKLSNFLWYCRASKCRDLIQWLWIEWLKQRGKLKSVCFRCYIVQNVLDSWLLFFHIELLLNVRIFLSIFHFSIFRNEVSITKALLFNKATAYTYSSISLLIIYNIARYIQIHTVKPHPGWSHEISSHGRRLNGGGGGGGGVAPKKTY